MKEVSVEDSKTIMIDILKDVSDFCDSNGIVYYLAYGTLLGAIRHKGFIPWDDDIDIMMPRPDFEKFICLYRLYGKYSICSPYEKRSFLVSTKIYDERTIKIEKGIDYKLYPKLGIDIDVFPIDGQNENISIHKKEVNKRCYLHRLLVCSIRPYSGLSLKQKLKTFILRDIIGKDFIIRQYMHSSKKYSYENSMYVGYANPYVPYNDRHLKTIFDKRIKAEFEGAEYWIPEGYDTFLKTIYGDYMKLPPIEQQVTHHKSIFCWKN